MSALRILGSIAGLLFVGRLVEQNRQLRLALDERTAINAALADEVLLYLWEERRRAASRKVQVRDDDVPGMTDGLKDEVDEAGEESFPASDPPSFNASR